MGHRNLLATSFGPIQVKLKQFFGDVLLIIYFGDVFYWHANYVEKQLLNFKNASVSHCFRIRHLE